MQVNTQNLKFDHLAISDFVESDACKQAEMEEKLENSKLEDIMSPVYFIFNVNAAIIGF